MWQRARQAGQLAAKRGAQALSALRFVRPTYLLLSALLLLVLLAVLGAHERLHHATVVAEAAERAASAAATSAAAAATAALAAARPAGRFECRAKRFVGGAKDGWTLCIPDESLHGATVYTIGVGRNIEWDRAMIRTFGTIHHGWDPTPPAVSFFRAHGPPPGFSFHPVGLGVADGRVWLKLPEGNRDSWTVMAYARKARKEMEFDVASLQSMMIRQAYWHVSVVKIDVEGMEFEVIAQWARARFRPPADQILVQFHERYFPESERGSMVDRAVADMRKVGFAVFHRRKTVSFLFKFACTCIECLLN